MDSISDGFNRSVQRKFKRKLSLRIFSNIKTEYNETIFLKENKKSSKILSFLNSKSKITL